jgi:hypothetical protein
MQPRAPASRGESPDQNPLQIPTPACEPRDRRSPVQTLLDLGAAQKVLHEAPARNRSCAPVHPQTGSSDCMVLSAQTTPLDEEDGSYLNITAMVQSAMAICLAVERASQPKVRPDVTQPMPQPSASDAGESLRPVPRCSQSKKQRHALDNKRESAVRDVARTARQTCG